jgi:hypothetical protein
MAAAILVDRRGFNEISRKNFLDGRMILDTTSGRFKYRLCTKAALSQEHDRNIIFPARGGRRARRLLPLLVAACGARAGFTVRACTLSPVFTFVAVKSFAEPPQTLKERDEQASALGQKVFDVRRASAIILALDERVMLHIAQPPDQRAAADRVQRRQQLRRSLRALKEIAYDQHRPFIAHQLQRARHGAAVTFASSHALSPFMVRL